MTKLPPDPDNMNEERAEWVASCLAIMSKTTGCEYGREALGDLLCNMFHWCDRNGLAGEMPNIFATAAENYRQETMPFDGDDDAERHRLYEQYGDERLKP